MPGPSQNHNFPGVDVSLPSKVQGGGAEEEWQEVDWVTWSTGDLSVDGDSFLLIFKPAGSSVKAKPLGSLLRASSVEQGEENRTLVVSTNDAINRLYRLTFQSPQHATEFSQIAKRAEASLKSSSSKKQDSKKRAAAAAEAMSKLEEAIRAALATSAPSSPPVLVFGGAELYGPDPNFAGGSEVLLGQGAVALLDPPEDAKVVGTYELIFYGEDEGARQPVKRVAIGPKSVLRKQPQEGPPVPDGPAIIFQLQIGPRGTAEPAHTLAFDDVSTGEAFARDFRVRLRVMEIASKTVRRGQQAEELRGELEGLKQRGFRARLRRFVSFLFVLTLLVAIARVAWLYYQEQGARPPAEYLQALLAEVIFVVRRSSTFAITAGSKACELVVGTVPVGALRQCLEVADKQANSAKALRRCVEELVLSQSEFAY